MLYQLVQFTCTVERNKVHVQLYYYVNINWISWSVMYGDIKTYSQFKRKTHNASSAKHNYPPKSLYFKINVTSRNYSFSLQ